MVARLGESPAARLRKASQQRKRKLRNPAEGRLPGNVRPPAEAALVARDFAPKPAAR